MHHACCYLLLAVFCLFLVFLVTLIVLFVLLVLYKNKYPWKTNVMDTIKYPPNSFQPTGTITPLTPQEQQTHKDVISKCLKPRT